MPDYILIQNALKKIGLSEQDAIVIRQLMQVTGSKSLKGLIESEGSNLYHLNSLSPQAQRFLRALNYIKIHNGMVDPNHLYALIYGTTPEEANKFHEIMTNFWNTPLLSNFLKMHMTSKVFINANK